MFCAKKPPANGLGRAGSDGEAAGRAECVRWQREPWCARRRRPAVMLHTRWLLVAGCTARHHVRATRMALSRSPGGFQRLARSPAGHWVRMRGQPSPCSRAELSLRRGEARTGDLGRAECPEPYRPLCRFAVAIAVHSVASPFDCSLQTAGGEDRRMEQVASNCRWGIVRLCGNSQSFGGWPPCGPHRMKNKCPEHEGQCHYHCS